MCRSQHHRRCDTGFIRLDPTQGTKTPAITGLKPCKAIFRARRRQIVSPLTGKREKLGGDLHANHMASEIVRRSLAAPGPEETGQWCIAASKQGPAEYVQLFLCSKVAHVFRSNKFDDPTSGASRGSDLAAQFAYPRGFSDCQRHASSHISSNPRSARQPSRRCANAGSAQHSATSPARRATTR